MTKSTFSDDDDIAEALPKSSHRAVNADWKPLDIHENDELEILSTSSVSISSQDKNEIREEIPKRSSKFWESNDKKNRGVEQNEDQGEGEMRKEVPKKGKKFWKGERIQQSRVRRRDEVSSRHVEEQENEREHKEHEESQEDETLDENEAPGREQIERQEQETVEHEAYQEDKTLDKGEVPEQHGESQEDKSFDQNKDEQSELHAVPELAQPTLRKSRQALENSDVRLPLIRNLLTSHKGRGDVVEGARNDDIIIP